MDTADQNCLEDEVERLRRALDGEFEEFISKAVHNLRHSLRDVAAYSQLMSEAYAGKLDPEADVFLGRIQEGAADMQSLLTDLMDYWATSATGLQSSATDMDAVICQALLRAAGQIAETSANVTHDALPRVCGDFESLTKVLHHLIRNAIEYGGTQVHISSTRADLDYVFSVRDNGPGIDRAFQGRLFRAFQRLHGEAYPGNGLGLAFCKRVIEAHGGRMWLESAPGAGSTFYFTVAAAD